MTSLVLPPDQAVLDSQPSPINLGSIRIRYNEDHPGSGKSTALRKAMVTHADRYLYMVASVDLVNESVQAIRDIAAQEGATPPTCVPIHSKANLGGRTVPRALDAEASRWPPGSHVVVVCTHQGAFGLDNFDAFARWCLFIDEVPSTVVGGVLATANPASANTLAGLYELEPIEAGWSRLTPKPGAPSVNSVMKDDLLKPLAELHRRAAQWLTLVDITDWSEVQQRGSWSWFAIWDLDRLTPFSEVRIIGNSLMDSLPIQIALSLNGSKDIVFKPFRLSRNPSAAPRAARDIHIHYFTQHPGTTTFWKTPDGRRCIDAIADWLKRHAGGDLMWSANEEVALMMAAAGLHGEKVGPLLAGLNAHRHRTWAALVYSAKMQPNERQALRIFAPDPAKVRQSREIEALVQFVFRTSLRDDTSAAMVNFVVYDRYQAEAVAAYINNRGLGSALPVQQDIGIGDIVPAKGRSGSARSPSAKPPQTDAERQRKSRATRRAKNSAGRPTP